LANASPTRLPPEDREAAKVAKSRNRHGACGFRDAHDDTMGTMKDRVGLVKTATTWQPLAPRSAVG